MRDGGAPKGAQNLSHRKGLGAGIRERSLYLPAAPRVHGAQSGGVDLGRPRRMRQRGQNSRAHVRLLHVRSGAPHATQLRCGGSGGSRGEAPSAA
eukprot:861566-Rhodomonas_salina.1